MGPYFTAFYSLNFFIDIVSDFFNFLILTSTLCVFRFVKVLWLSFWSFRDSWFCDFLLKFVFDFIIFLLWLFFFFLLFYRGRLWLNLYRFWFNNGVEFLIAFGFLWLKVFLLKIFLLFDFWRLIVSFWFLLFDDLFGG